jgi:hypothetical protein
MFEPQDHPRDEAYPGGPPVPPYDIAGWTLAMQMGVEYDKILDGFNGPFVKLKFEKQAPEPGFIFGVVNPAGYLISHRNNNSFVLVNRLLKNKADVYWLKSPPEFPALRSEVGVIWIPASSSTLPILQKGAKELGIIVNGVGKPPSGEALKIQPVRIGLYDQYGGMMPSGWTRWLFEQFEFPFEIVYPTTLDAGNLRSKFDVLVFADGAMRRGTTGRGAGGGRGGAVDPATVPEEYRASIGRITEDKTMPEIKKFVESGGAIVTVGSSTTMAELLGVPVSNHLADLPRDKFYIPGSLMRATIDNTNPLAYGMPNTVEMFFDNSPVFNVGAGVKQVASFNGKQTLDSGWAWGQEYLDGGTAVAEAKVGEGKVLLMGPEVTFRGEPHATFKLMFNSVLYGNAQTTQLK